MPAVSMVNVAKQGDDNENLLNVTGRQFGLTG